MSVSNPSIIDTRRDQISAEIAKTPCTLDLRCVENRKRFGTGEALATAGQIGEGFGIVLEGRVDVYRYDAYGERKHFYTFRIVQEFSVRAENDRQLSRIDKRFGCRR